jgi:hypothetical protein
MASDVPFFFFYAEVMLGKADIIASARGFRMRALSAHYNPDSLLSPSELRLLVGLRLLYHLKSIYYHRMSTSGSKELPPASLALQVPVSDRRMTGGSAEPSQNGKAALQNSPSPPQPKFNLFQVPSLLSLSSRKLPSSTSLLLPPPEYPRS